MAREALDPEFILPNLIASSVSYDSETDHSISYLRPAIPGVAVSGSEVSDVIGYLFNRAGAIGGDPSSSSSSSSNQTSSNASASRSSRTSRSVTNDSVDYGSEILVSDNDMTLDFSNLGLGEDDNPFNRWADYVNRANNAPQV